MSASGTKKDTRVRGVGKQRRAPCLLSPLATSPLACAFYHSLLCSPLEIKSLLTGSCGGCWSYNMKFCSVGVQMTPRKKDRSRGVGCWYIIILLRTSAAKTCKNYECMRQVKCNHLGPYLLLILWSFSNVDGDVKENGQKNNRSRLAKQQLCTCITLSVHFFTVTPRQRRETEGREHKSTTFFFS